MNWEVIGVLIGVVGLGFLVYQYFLLPGRELKEQRQAIVILFDTSRHLIDRLINDLTCYAEMYNGNDVQFNAGFTISGYLKYLTKIRDEELSDYHRSQLLTTKLTIPIIEQFRQSLNRQIHSFNESQAYLDSRIKHISFADSSYY